LAALLQRGTSLDPAGAIAQRSTSALERDPQPLEARLNEPISLDDLATVVGMGVGTFSRHFRETLGRAPHAFVIDRRVERAKRLLSQGDLASRK
jgi:AraC family transcriptional regulator